MGKEIVYKAFRREKTVRTPWVPFVGCHGAKLIGVDAKSYLQSSELMIEGLTHAIERYKPDGIPVIFDLQIEAEALGCELKWSDSAPPAVISHPLLTNKTIDQLKIPSPDSCRIPEVIRTTKALKKKDAVTLVGFGTFKVDKRKARKGRNPQTGEEIKIKAKKVPKFIAGKALKDAVK